MSEAISQIPLESLRESPTNPRKTFNDATLQELADSIKSQGVLQPIVVRPVVDRDIQHTHEIVFGHRRYRAADLAGIERMPCIVRAMTDEAAAIAQLHENLEREDVHAIEEAEGFARLMQDHGVTADQLVQQTGKSRTYIYARLKLATLSEPVREACLEGLIGAEVATLIGRVPAPLQGQALARCVYTDHSDPAGPVQRSASFRQAKSAITDGFTNPLADADFNVAEEGLLLGIGACAGCPKLSNNDPALAELGADVCTDTSCWERKTEAGHVARIAWARSMGRVIEGEAAAPPAGRPPHMAPAGYLRMTDWLISGEQHPTTKAYVRESVGAAIELLRRDGQTVPAVTYVMRDKQTFECVTDAQAREMSNAVRELLGLNAASAPTPSTAARRVDGDGEEGRPRVDPTADWTAEERVVLDPVAWRRVRAAVLDNLVKAKRTLAELRAMAAREIRFGFDEFEPAHVALGLDKAYASDAALLGDAALDEGVWMEQWVGNANADQLGALLAAVAIDDELDKTGYYFGNHPNGRAVAQEHLALAKRYGVDVLAMGVPSDQTDDAGGAGETERDPNTADMFEAAA